MDIYQEEGSKLYFILKDLSDALIYTITSF
jgi:hypothetical protein